LGALILGSLGPGLLGHQGLLRCGDKQQTHRQRCQTPNRRRMCSMVRESTESGKGASMRKVRGKNWGFMFPHRGPWVRLESRLVVQRVQAFQPAGGGRLTSLDTVFLA
jgi:hypothetical protein